MCIIESEHICYDNQDVYMNQTMQNTSDDVLRTFAPAKMKFALIPLTARDIVFRVSPITHEARFMYENELSEIENVLTKQSIMSMIKKHQSIFICSNAALY